MSVSIEIDLTYEGIATQNNTANMYPSADIEIDLTYEGIATSFGVFQLNRCILIEIDLTYEGIATKQLHRYGHFSYILKLT